MTTPSAARGTLPTRKLAKQGRAEVVPSKLEGQNLPSESASLLENYLRVRRFSEHLCATLEPEDYVIQTVPEMSPTKWHLAHTSWFFETFLIKPHLPDYRPLNPQYAFLFNSYYNAAGKMHARPQRGLISRPTVKDTYAYRRHVDGAMERVLRIADERRLRELAPLVELGVNHEQQHQELMLTDIKHAFWMNPLRPTFQPEEPTEESGLTSPGWRNYDAALYWIGHGGEGFCFDNERPRHQVYLHAFALATRLVTNQEYLAFMEEGGYHRSEWWLSLGWAAVNERGWSAPFYWEQRDGHWWMFTLAGMRPVQMSEPVCHLSYFEADAFARWAGARLPTEAEWEIAAGEVPFAGSFVESGRFHPAPASGLPSSDRLCQMFGETWQWTQTAYSPYPGFKAPAGALGEYNGKFMCNQYVLRGASCATPRTHVRRSYRNFFPPDARWQFMGLRLAKDLL
jgi:ergothioneine biosynthesis protein EgtB